MSDCCYFSVLNPTEPSSGGGVSGVSNPMTADLDGGSFDIDNVNQLTSNQGNITNVNATTVTATDVTATNGNFSNLTFANLNGLIGINDTFAPQFVNVGSISPLGATEYHEIATINPPVVDAEGCCTFVIQARDFGFQQFCYFSVIALPTKSSIKVINHQAESDTLIFDRIVYGDQGGNILTVGVHVATPSNTCEFTFYQNQGLGVGSSNSFNPTTTSPVVSIPSPITEVVLNQLVSTATNLGAQIEGYVVTGGEVQAGGGVRTNTLTSISSATILSNSNLDMSGNIVDKVQTLRVSGVEAYNTANVNVFSNVDCQANSIINLTDINGAGGTLLLTATDLNAQGNAFVGVGDAQLTSLSATVGTDIIVNTDLNMNTNAINDVGNLRVQNIRKNGGVDINIQDDIDMKNNVIRNLANPVVAQDGATKDYVDTAVAGGGAGFVTNPMTVTLDGGGNIITNVTTYNGTNAVIGNLTGNGLVAGNFLNGTSTITGILDIQANTDFNDDRVEYATATVVWKSNDSANDTTAWNDNAGRIKLPRWNPLAGGVQRGNFNFASGAVASTGGDYPVLYGNEPVTGALIEKVIMPLEKTNCWCQDATVFGEGGVPPSGGPNTWTAVDNGQEIRLPIWDIFRQANAGVLGAGQVGQVHFIWSGFITGIWLKVDSPWLYTGTANTEVVITIGGIPTVIGQYNFAPPFHYIAIPEALWIPFVAGDVQPDINLRLNITGADTISTNGFNAIEGHYFSCMSITQ